MIGPRAAKLKRRLSAILRGRAKHAHMTGKDVHTVIRSRAPIPNRPSRRRMPLLPLLHRGIGGLSPNGTLNPGPRPRTTESNPMIVEAVGRGPVADPPAERE